MNEAKKYDVALSFAGEDRYFVREVAEILKVSGVKVFYDEFEESNLWGRNLYTYLGEVYKDHAKYTVMFCSQYYKNKLWTNHEREFAQERAFKDSADYILPARFDDTEIPGVSSTTGYIDLRTKTPYEFSKIVCSKLGISVNDEAVFDRSLHDAVAKTLEEEKSLSKVELEARNNHWDAFQYFMDSLGSNEKHEHQKKNSLHYLRKYGISVSQIKNHLIELSFYNGTVDNEFDVELAEAITTFQKLSNLKHVDGMIGQLTLKEIEVRLKERVGGYLVGV